MDFDTIPNTEYCLKISDMRFLTVRPFMENTRVDIREWTAPNAPTKKGVTFPIYRWKNFAEQLDDIKKMAEKLFKGEEVNEKYHLGGNVHVSINNQYPAVDIRHFWVPPEAKEPVATRKGLALKKAEWEVLLTAFPMVEQAVSEYEEIQLCHLNHQNQMSTLTCPECNPNTF